MKTLLCFGDSNTHGTLPMKDLETSGRYGRAERWTDRLGVLLPHWQIISEGHPGRTTEHDDPVMGAHRNGSRVLLAILESHRPIDVVLLMLGTNDLKAVFDVSAAQIAQSLQRQIDVILASGAGPEGRAPEILLVAPPPILETGCLAEVFAGGAAKSIEIADHLRQLADHNNLPFVNLAGVISVSRVDGIHYEAEANPILAETFARAIHQHFG